MKHSKYQPDFQSSAIDPKGIKVGASKDRTSKGTSSNDPPEKNINEKSITPGQHDHDMAFSLDHANPLAPEKSPDQRSDGVGMYRSRPSTTITASTCSRSLLSLPLNYIKGNVGG